MPRYSKHTAIFGFFAAACGGVALLLPEKSILVYAARFFAFLGASFALLGTRFKLYLIGFAPSPFEPAADILDALCSGTGGFSYDERRKKILMSVDGIIELTSPIKKRFRISKKNSHDGVISGKINAIQFRNTKWSSRKKDKIWRNERFIERNPLTVGLIHRENRLEYYGTTIIIPVTSDGWQRYTGGEISDNEFPDCYIARKERDSVAGILIFLVARRGNEKGMNKNSWSEATLALARHLAILAKEMGWKGKEIPVVIQNKKKSIIKRSQRYFFEQRAGYKTNDGETVLVANFEFL